MTSGLLKKSSLKKKNKNDLAASGNLDQNLAPLGGVEDLERVNN
jgi:hypothetical protein